MLKEEREQVSVERTYNVYDPEISSDHKDYYESIARSLMNLFPICSQGLSLAENIGGENAEQSQIIGDLMGQVEDFAEKLQMLSKTLFDKYYQSKEQYARFLFSNTAYITINLMDRNLLERTCDVRWWSLETAFGRAVHLSNKFSDSLRETLEDCGNSEMAAFLVEPSLVFERYPALQDDEKLTALATKVTEANAFACSRLEDIRRSYTLYRDLVITTRDGIVIANANCKRRRHVLGTFIADEEWFSRAIATKDGTGYFAQDLQDSALEDEPSLIYSTAIRAKSEVDGAVIGSMGVLFDFSGESKIILDEVLPNQNGAPVDGWHCFLTNSTGQVLQSSDPLAFPVGTRPYLPRSHRELGQGKRQMSFIDMLGLPSAVFSAKTDGYLEYPGLGWTAHLIVPKSVVFASDATARRDVDMSELHRSQILPGINRETYKQLSIDQQDITRISLNGMIFAAQVGAEGNCLAPVFNQITKTGRRVAEMMHAFLDEMALSDLDLNLTSLENFSDQAINIVDRNLFERAADIRWWATDAVFWQALKDPSDAAFERASKRLRVINDSYTMYRNLILLDANGKVVACSDQRELQRLSHLDFPSAQWYQDTLATTGATEYAVRDASPSRIEPNKNISLIYAGGVRNEGAGSGPSIGVLAICFDWDVEARNILDRCMPREPATGDVLEGCCAFYTDSQFKVIESANEELIPLGQVIELPEAYLKTLTTNRITSGFYHADGTDYLIGSALTKGYREYAGLGWSAHVIRPYLTQKKPPELTKGFSLNATVAADELKQNPGARHVSPSEEKWDTAEGCSVI